MNRIKRVNKKIKELRGEVEIVHGIIMDEKTSDTFKKDMFVLMSVLERESNFWELKRCEWSEPSFKESKERKKEIKNNYAKTLKKKVAEGNWETTTIIMMMVSFFVLYLFIGELTLFIGWMIPYLGISIPFKLSKIWVDVIMETYNRDRFGPDGVEINPTE